LSSRDLSKKAQKSITGSADDLALAGNMDLITSAHSLLTRLGYKDIEIMDLLSTAHFLAGGESPA
jgi:hypothetical protein